jgi:NAD(P)H dehydrogenase (quinone)
MAVTETTVAIVYHSSRGHTAKQAEAVQRGASRVSNTAVLLLPVEEAQNRFDELARVDAIIFGAPTYMGSASAPFKAFMDASSKVYATGAWRDKVAAGFTNSACRSGDKLETLLQFAIFAAQHSMHWVSLGLPSGNNSSTGSEEDLNRLGFFLGAGAQSNADEGAEVAPTASDLKTAEHLGERVAQATAQLVRGRLRQQVGSPVDLRLV